MLPIVTQTTGKPKFDFQLWAVFAISSAEKGCSYFQECFSFVVMLAMIKS